MKRVVLVLALLCAVAYAADIIRVKLGINAPSAGQLLPGEFGFATNTLVLYIGDRSSNADATPTATAPMNLFPTSAR